MKFLSRSITGKDDMSHLMTKPTKWHTCPAKTQRSTWASTQSDQSSLSAWRKLGSLTTHWAHSEDCSDWMDAQADLSLRWVHCHFCWFYHEVAQLFLPCHLHLLGAFLCDKTILFKFYDNYSKFDRRLNFLLYLWRIHVLDMSSINWMCLPSIIVQ